MEQEKSYIAIDLKSFYASVECVERGLDPLATNLVVADASRTEKTICLAVSPSLKAYGIPGRARLFEVVQRVNEVNKDRLRKAPGHAFSASSYFPEELAENASLQLGYIAAVPRMALYLEYSAKIYQVYLKYIAPEDIHVYSIDEVFMDVTHYLRTYQMTPKELAEKMVLDVFETTGITATAGIGTNLYLCKVAMDIVAKHVAPNENGVRVAELTEQTYRELLWNHTPLTDFWRVGPGIAKKLTENGLFTMGDVARCSIGGQLDFYNEELLYKLFGVNAELLIDHAWGYEPTTISDVKAYKPKVNCLSSGQVLQSPYTFLKARIIVREMTDLLVLDLVEKNLVTDQLVLTIGYDIDNLLDDKIAKNYTGEITVDHYGRRVPKAAHGTANLPVKCSSTKRIMEAVLKLFDEIVDPNLLVRRINITANRILPKEQADELTGFEQMDLFQMLASGENSTSTESTADKEAEDKERRLQEAMLAVKKRYGKNAMLKGTNLQEGAMTIERNNQIGGHKA